MDDELIEIMDEGLLEGEAGEEILEIDDGGLDGVIVEDEIIGGDEGLIDGGLIDGGYIDDGLVDDGIVLVDDGFVWDEIAVGDWTGAGCEIGIWIIDETFVPADCGTEEITDPLPDDAAICVMVPCDAII
jgi:hypothetical protein